MGFMFLSAWPTLYIEPTQLFLPSPVSIHSIGLRKIVNIHRFALNFWATKAYKERKDGIFVSSSNVVRKVKSLGDEYFYEAACCQAPFPFYMSGTPSVVNRASGFLKREAVICLERTSIRAGFSLPDTRCCIRPQAIREAPG
jgi:hypothetical protein